MFQKNREMQHYMDCEEKQTWRCDGGDRYERWLISTVEQVIAHRISQVVYGIL